MATQNTTLLNSQAGVADFATGQQYPTSIDAGGVLKVISDTYTVGTAITTAQFLGLCKLPIGAKVVGGTFNVAAASGPSGASKIGIGTITTDGLGTVTVTDDDRYGTVSNINAAAGAYAFQCVLAADFDTPTTSELVITFTPVGASLAAAAVIGFTIFYVTA